jgi:hypothetical protein
MSVAAERNSKATRGRRIQVRLGGFLLENFMEWLLLEVPARPGRRESDNPI